jgi:hypothetical protein
LARLPEHKLGITGTGQVLERIVGAGVIAYMLAVAVQVVTRAASYDSSAPFAEALQMIAANQGLYLVSVSAGQVSNIFLVALTAGLYFTFQGHQSQLALLGALTFLAAALTWLMSGAAGIALASLAQEFSVASGTAAEITAGNARAVDLVREAAGRTGFTLAALSLMVFGFLIAWRDAVPKWLGWLGLAVGVLMFLIWNDDAAVLHRIGGAGYLLWLLITGCWLLTRGVRPVPEEAAP